MWKLSQIRKGLRAFLYKNSPPERLILRFTEKGEERLEKIRVRLGISDKPTVVFRALGLIEICSNALSEGLIVVAYDEKSGEYEEIIVKESEEKSENSPPQKEKSKLFLVYTNKDGPLAPE